MGNYAKYAPTVEQGLANFKSVMGPEIQEEANSFANSNKSLLSSLRAGMGGQEMANPGLVLGNMAGQAQQADMQNSQALGMQLGNQGLSALSDLGNFISGPIGSAMSGLQGIGSIYAGAAGQGGNPWTGAMGGLGNFLGMLGQGGGATGAQGVQAAALAGLGASEAEYPPQITGDITGSTFLTAQLQRRIRLAAK